MSCGQIALNRAGIKYDNYYASEIKAHAIKVTQHNYPKYYSIRRYNKNKNTITLFIGCLFVYLQI